LLAQCKIFRHQLKARGKEGTEKVQKKRREHAPRMSNVQRVTDCSSYFTPHRPEVIAELRRIAEPHVETVKPVKSQLDERLPAETTGKE
jgi:hypothetical protein